MSEEPEKIWAWSYVDIDHGNCHWNTGEWYLEEDTDLDGDEVEYTRSDLALAAQGALLKKAAAVDLTYPSFCSDEYQSAWDTALLEFSEAIHDLSPDATAALAEREAKIRNDTLREALEKITSNYPKNADTDYDKGLDYGLTSAAVIIEALITTEGEG